MSLTVALAVLFAAALHASWNALLRFHGDRIAIVVMATGFGGLFALPGVVWLEPPDPASWPWLGASALLNTGYSISLAHAYTHGELGRVYPLARGTAPLLTLVAGALLLGQTVTAVQAAGIVTLAGGILVLTLEGGLAHLRRSPRAAGYALITSVFIASYTLVDGTGARISGNPHAYIQWLQVLHALPLLVWGLIAARVRLAAALKINWRSGSVAGLLSFLAYWIAVWAMTVAPIAAVAALRETSVLFAVLIGVVFLREPFSVVRLASAVSVLAGLVALRM